MQVSQSNSHVTRHTYHTSHVTHITRHTSHISHVTHHTYHTSHVTHITRHTSHVTRHTSHVTRHTSHVTRHTSHFSQRAHVLPVAQPYPPSPAQRPNGRRHPARSELSTSQVRGGWFEMPHVTCHMLSASLESSSKMILKKQSKVRTCPLHLPLKPLSPEPMAHPTYQTQASPTSASSPN